MKSIIVYTILTLCVLVATFPFLWVVTTSFKPDDQVLTPTFLWAFTPVWHNYAAIFQDPRFMHRLSNSIIISLITVLITVPVGSMAGYAFARFPIRKKENWFFLMLTSRIAPPVAFIVPFYLLLLRGNLIDSHVGLIAVYVFMNLAFTIWLTRGFFEEIPIEVEEAAYLDGCNRLMCFFHITVPLAIGGIISIAVLIFIFSWNEFLFASILTRNHAATYPVHLTTYFGARRIEWGQLFAASTIVSLIPIIFAMFTRKYIVRGFSLGAVRNTN